MGATVSRCEEAEPVEEQQEEVEQEPVAQVEEMAEKQDAAAAEEDEEAEEAEEPAVEVQVKTAPYDPRFPSVNQARHCYTRYNEFYKCSLQKGEDDEQCKFYQRAYRSICPGEWVEKWNEQREEGTWAGKY